MSTRVLLVEDDPADAYVFRRHLRSGAGNRFDLEHVGRLGDGLDRLSSEVFEVLVLDLGLPDSQGLETFLRVHHAAPDTAIIVLSGNDDEELALQAVREGAQDYLVKGELTTALLVRSIRYALERHQLQQSLRSLSLTDELTGLYNRRGFLTLADQQLKQARRAHRILSLVFVDLDGLKHINDTLGHPVGDAALIETARILRRSFRDTDVVARVGGDEFAVLLVDATEDGIPVPLSRFEANLERTNAAPERAYPLELSYGLAVRGPDDGTDLSDLMEQADQAMYRAKHEKTERRSPNESTGKSEAETG